MDSISRYQPYITNLNIYYIAKINIVKASRT